MKRFFYLLTAVIIVFVSIPIQPTSAIPTDSLGEVTQGPSTLFYNNPTARQSTTITQDIPIQTFPKAETVEVLDLWLDVAPAIFIPDKPAIFSWRIENVELLSGFDSAVFKIYSNSPLTINDAPGELLETGMWQYRIPITSDQGSIPVSQSEPINQETVELQVEFLNGAELLKTEIIILPVAQAHTSGDPTPLQHSETLVKVKPSKGLQTENLFISIANPSPHRVPTTALSDNTIEILAVDLTTGLDLTYFDPPLQVTMPYDPTQISPQKAPNLQVHFFDSENQLWVPMATQVDLINHTLTVLTDHLTIFDYSATDWQTYQQPQLENYEISGFTGAATYNYGFQSFPGTNGLTPSLGLSYSSLIVDNAIEKTQASWVGLGWNFDTGSITRDMHNTPEYFEDDTFFVSLGGLGGRLLPVSEKDDIKYYSVVDTSFDIIEYQQSLDMWTIYTNDGLVHTLGGSEEDFAWVNPTVGCSANAYSQTTDIVWKWQLNQTRDRFGNTINYTNIPEPKKGCTNTLAIRPEKIEYDNFQIIFNTTDQRQDWVPGWDNPNDITLFSKHRLDSISFYITQPSLKLLKSYRLTYSDPYFGPGEHNNLLEGIQLFDADENYLPKVRFTYFPHIDGDEAFKQLRLESIHNGYGGQIRFDYEHKDADLPENQQFPPTAKWYFSGMNCITPVKGWEQIPLIGTPNSLKVNCDEVLLNPIRHLFPDTLIRGNDMVGANLVMNTEASQVGTAYLGFREWGSNTLDSDTIIPIPITDPHMTLSLNLRIPADIATKKYEVFFSGKGIQLETLAFILPIAHVAVSKRTETETITGRTVTWDYQYSDKFGVSGYDSGEGSEICLTDDCYYTPRGTGFRGYSEVRMTRRLPEKPPADMKPLVVVSQYYQNDDLKGRLQRQRVQLGLDDSSAKLISETEYEYEAAIIKSNQDLPAPLSHFFDLDVRWVYVTSKKTTNLESLQDQSYTTQFVTQETYKYDDTYVSSFPKSFAHLVSTTLSYFNGLEQTEPKLVSEIAQSTDYLDPFFSDYWLPSLPVSQTSQCMEGAICSPGSDLRESLISYNAMHQPEKQKTLINAEQYAQVALNYFPNGQLASKTVWQDYAGKFDDPTGVGTTTHYTYDSLFPSSPASESTTITQNSAPLTFLTQTAYDATTGQPIRVSHPDGSVEGAAYDGFGRLIRICAPYDWDPSQQSCSQAANPTARVSYQIAEGQHYSVTVEKIGLPTTIAYYDSLGKQLEQRQIGAEIEGVRSWVRQVALHYDTYGRQTLALQPQAFPLPMPEWSYIDIANQTDVTSTLYDDQDRVIEFGRGQDRQGFEYYRESSTAYYAQLDGSEYLLVTAVTDANGNTSTAYKDLKGQLILARPPNNLGPEVRNTYDAFGQLVQTQYGPAISTFAYNYAGQKVSMDDADMGTWSYTYNALGSLLTQTDARNETVCMGYDQLNRLTSKSYGVNCDTPVSAYLYDQNGQLGYRTGMIDVGANVSINSSWTFDLRGRVTSETRVVNGESFTASWQYNSADQMTRMTYPSGMTLDYSYLPQGGTRSITGFQNNLQVDALGRVTQRTLSNQTTTSYTYQPFLEAANRLERILTNNTNYGVQQDYTYTYDALGNILSITDAAWERDVQTFTYDDMNRLLTSAGTYQYSGQLYSSTTTYNPITGNIASKDGNTYTYSSTKPHAVIQAGARTFGYDANGNMTHEGGVPKFTYNPEGKLTTREGYAYSYDGDGKRVMELNPGGKTTIWVGNYYEQSNQQSSNTFNETIYADGVRIGMRKNNQTNYWFHLDHLGGTHVITMSEGQFNSRDLYKAWGEERYSQGNTDTRYRYTGQMREGDIYYYGARWYDPAIGRFMQADTIVPADIQGTQAFDRYAYVNNNPLRYTDPSGNFAITGAILIGVAGGAIIGYAGQVIHNLANDMSFKDALTTDISAGWIIGGAVAGGALGGIGFAALSHFGIINTAATATTTASGLCADGNCINEASTFGNGASGAYGDLSQAAEHGIKAYRELRKATTGTGLQVHHLVERRFANLLRLTTSQSGSIPSVVVTPEEHQVFTNEWRSVIGYVNSISNINTSKATYQDVYSAVNRIYQNYPVLLEESRHFLERLK